MQIHADSKGTARISYQLLWMTSHYGPTIVRVSRRYHFTFSFDRILFKWGWILHRELYSVSPTSLCINFQLQATTAHNAFVHKICSCICSTNIKRMPQVWNDDPMPLILDLLNPKSICFDRLSRTTTVPSLKSFQSEESLKMFKEMFSFYRANIPTRTHTHTLWQSDSYICAAVLRRRRG